MCQISDQIKLCTCSSVKGIKSNVWYLSRFHENEKQIMGEVVGGFFDRTESHRETHLALESILNETNRFDQEMNLQEEDWLKIKLPISNIDKVATFEFIYENGKWRKTILDPFSRDSYKFEKSGFVKN